MDAYFLKMAVGPVLTEALSVVVQTNPTDPIDFLGHFLLNAAQLEKKKAEWEKELALEASANATANATADQETEAVETAEAAQPEAEPEAASAQPETEN